MDKYIDKYTDNIYETDYIPREAVRCEMYHNQEPLTEYQLNSTTAADMRPVVRGKWENMVRCEAECSVCKRTMLVRAWWHFCPNCGANMREDISNFTLEEQKTYWEAIEKKSIDTGVNIHDLI